MRPLLQAHHYASDEAFQQETQGIFRSLWIFAAVKSMLGRHNDFRTLKIGGRPVVLQNSNGQIRAFANICRHRGAPVQTEEFGNRPLVCAYHHWSYDAGGRLQHTHKDPAVFGLTADEIAGIALQEYKVAVVGGLVFVNLDPGEPLTIEAQFGAHVVALLASATECMDDTHVYTRYDVDFNWKIGIENIKDPLHVQCLHKSSFPETFKIDVSGPSVEAALTRAPIDVPLQAVTTFGDVVIDDDRVLPWRAFVEHLDSAGHYRQFGLYPNTNFMIVNGTSFSIQTYNPVSAGKTEMQMIVALTRPVADFAYKPVVLWAHLRSDMKVLQEDIECLEGVQANFASATSEIVHGAYEIGILQFQAVCLERMRLAGADSA